MDPEKLQKIDQRQKTKDQRPSEGPGSYVLCLRSSKGVALLLTTALALLFMILVAGFYQTVIGRQRWAHQRVAKSSGFYKAEAGTQDAMARLRLGRLGSAVPPAIDPLAGSNYCLDVENPTNLCPPPAPPPLPCSAPCDVHVTVSQQDPITKLNQIDAVSEY